MRKQAMIAAYVKINSDKQTVVNQVGEIKTWCKEHGVKVTYWCRETVSGTRDEHKCLLGRLINHLQAGDTLIVSEVSQLSRKMTHVMNMIHNAIERGITVHSIKEGYTFDPTMSDQSLSFAFGLSAEVEGNLISQRTKQALERRRAAGLPLGRPHGIYSLGLLEPHKTKVLYMRGRGLSYRKIGLQFDVSAETVRKFCIRLKALREGKGLDFRV